MATEYFVLNDSSDRKAIEHICMKGLQYFGTVSPNIWNLYIILIQVKDPMSYTNSEGPDQTAHLRSLIKAVYVRLCVLQHPMTPEAENQTDQTAWSYWIWFFIADIWDKVPLFVLHISHLNPEIIWVKLIGNYCSNMCQTACIIPM